MDRDEINNRFSSHDVSREKKELMDQMRMMLGAIASFMNEKIADGRENR